MLIGTKYSDNKLYRGIKHYDHLPLTSSDLHEYADILQMKNAYFMNNLLGSGTINEPKCSISSDGIYLNEPSVALIDGDIVLINSDEGTPIISTTDIANAGYTDGVLCIVGWYQSLTASSTLRNYGGVNNSVLENDIIDDKLQMQVSTRYQLRWDIVLLDSESYTQNGNINITLVNRDETGEITTGSMSLTTGPLIDNIRVITRPSSMTYAVSDLYVVPILKYNYSNSNISGVKAYPSIAVEGTTSFIKSETEPVGEYREGTIWYNPISYKFKFYVPKVGFVATASDLALMQYHSTFTMTSRVTTPSNIDINIGISSFTEGDILQVIYEGVVLTENTHYVVDINNKKITLLDFTSEIGDIITFISIKLVDTNTSTSVASEFNIHVNTIGNSQVKGHVSLSDTPNVNQGVESGIAATPKSLYNATLIKDTSNNLNYKFVVIDGILYLEEV